MKKQGSEMLHAETRETLESEAPWFSWWYRTRERKLLLNNCCVDLTALTLSRVSVSAETSALSRTGRDLQQYRESSSEQGCRGLPLSMAELGAATRS